MHHNLFNRRLHGLLLVLFIAIFLALPALAQKERRTPLVLIRDTEIENTLKRWAEPVIKAAGLEEDAIKIILIQDKSLNAFVAGGPNIFIYTGLLEKSESPGEVIGVLAHELGHISGGHLVRSRGAIEDASYESLLGTLLGIGAAIVTGEGGLGAAVAVGTQSTALNKFLSFSRVQESSADQAALRFLENAQMNPEGLVSFMQKLESEELLPASQQSEYIRTHPLTRDRVRSLKSGHERSAWKDASYPAAWNDQHKRMNAKLKAFITPERVAWDFDVKDQSIVADYARAIAAYRQNHVEDSLALVDNLLQRESDNPYFLELKGQMLVDYSRVEEALQPYRQAVALDKDAALIRIAYAHALIESSSRHPERLDQAIEELQRALRDEPKSTRIYRLLATAHGRKGQNAMAKLYLAEEAVLKQDRAYAKQQATAALKDLPEGSRARLRAQDILSYLEQIEKRG